MGVTGRGYAPDASCTARHGVDSLILPTLLQEQAEHLDQPPELAAKKFTTVEVPGHDGTLGWQWHPALGLIEYR